MAVTDEHLALAALRAWNGVPEDHPFEWPKDFPEGSRAAWLRVVRAVTAPYRAAANPGRSLTELPSLHQPDRLQGEDAFQDKREPRNSPAAPIEDSFQRASRLADPDCLRCDGAGQYPYDHNHTKICEVCCKHDLGWHQLGEMYGDLTGQWCCVGGCGTVHQEKPE